MVVAPPQGHWRLPPQQCILQRPETLFDLHCVARELTVVVSTSVGEFTPSVDTPVAALESLQSNVALRWCRKLLVFDRVPSADEIEEMRRDPESFHHVARGMKWMATWDAKREAYEEYCDTLRAMKEANHPALFNVELLFLPRFGHLFGTVKHAFQHVRTRYVFVTQHDLRLNGGKFVAADVQRILEALHSKVANYIVLNRDVNCAVRTMAYFRMAPEHSFQDARKPAGLSLTAMAGFSDQAHFAEVDWYRSEVIDAIPPNQELTCMEHVLHGAWKGRGDWRGTFLYGGPDEGPFVLDLIYGLQVYDHGGHLRRLPPPPSRNPE